jgi:hypothetical protein
MMTGRLTQMNGLASAQALTYHGNSRGKLDVRLEDGASSYGIDMQLGSTDNHLNLSVANIPGVVPLRIVAATSSDGNHISYRYRGTGAQSIGGTNYTDGVTT